MPRKGKPQPSFETWTDRQMHGARGRSALTRELLDDLRRVTPHCKCCGIELTYEGYVRTNIPQHYATLDRIRPDLGYAPWNVAIICFQCNTRKRNLRADDLRQLLRYIEAHEPVLR